MNKMVERDVRSLDLTNEDLTLHLSRKDKEAGIEKNGLVAQIGENSKGKFGREKTSKVFFTKSIKGTLMFINRILNMVDNSIEAKNMDSYANTQYSYFTDIYNANYEEGMSRQEETQIANKIVAAYLRQGIMYNCNLQYCTKDEYAKMNYFKKSKIDYLIDDNNEERDGEVHPINNMHTISGKGISRNKLEKLTIDGSDSALDITRHIIEKYKELHPGEKLPFIDEGEGKRDTPLLEGFYEDLTRDEMQKDENEVFLNKLKDLNESRDEVLKKDIEHEQEKTQEIDSPEVENVKE